MDAVLSTSHLTLDLGGSQIRDDVLTGFESGRVIWAATTRDDQPISASNLPTQAVRP